MVRINSTISNLTGTGFAGADVIYGGSVAHWNKFINSLKLKLAF